jgi:effector-binding domain-containing protein
MFPRLALRIGIAVATVALAAGVAPPRPAAAQTAVQTAPPAATPTPPADTATPAAPEGATTQPGDPFGLDTTLTAKTIVYVKGTGTWDSALATITKSFKTVESYVAKEGLKTDGLPMTIFTATDDSGFEYEAAIPLSEPPKNIPHGIALGKSPEGRALEFVHRGSYEALDNTYEAITNYLDEKRLDAKDLFIEEYVTDPVSADADKLVVNVFVMIK